MKESDWKVFVKIKDQAIEKFCSLALDDSKEVISNHNDHVHDRYLSLYELLQNRNKQMEILFDGHSRSRALLQLLAIRAEGLADEISLSELSDEFREQTDPKKLNR